MTGLELIQEWAVGEGYDYSEVRVCLLDTLHRCALAVDDEERIHRPTILIGSIRIFFMYGRYYISRDGRQCLDSPIDIEDPGFFGKLKGLMVELV